MAFYSNFLAVIGAIFQPTEQTNPVAIVLSKSDGSPDLQQSGGNGDALVSLSTASTAALASQTTLASVLAQIILVLDQLTQPGVATPVTKSDATDLTALATKGLRIGGSGTLVYRLVGAPTVDVTETVQPGQFVEGRFTRVMAATTATGITALS